MCLNINRERRRTMAKITEVPEIEEFMAGPLVTWFSSCLEMVTDEKVTYDNLVNGYLIHNVFLQMNLQVQDTNVYPSTVDSVAWRTRNLLAVLNNIRHFYEDELNQVILRLPDVENLGREPEYHVKEVEILLGLLLGCAVQCPKKKGFIETITRLDETSQLVIAECIAEIVKVPGILISADMLIDQQNVEKVIECIRKIRNERDEYKVQLRHRREHEEDQLSEVLCEKSQLKLKITSLTEQLREKSNELEDTQAELKELEKKLCDLTKIHEILVLGAKEVKYYRDILDEANASVEKIEHLEKDISCYQKKLGDFDICKTRLKELEKSNTILEESKVALENQLTLQKTEREKMRDLKKQITKLTEQVNNLTAENIENRDKYWTVNEEKNELQRLVNEFHKKTHVNHHSNGIPSLKDDFMLKRANSQVAKLQNDNQSLTTYNETLKHNLLQKSDKISVLSRENKKLSQIVEKLNVEIELVKENFNREAERSKSLQNICNKALSEAKKMHQQEFEHVRSLLENAQKRSSSSENNNPNVSIDATVKSVPLPIVQGEQKYTVVKSRKLLKYVKTQS